ncbi:MAG: oxidoreductase [Candidatus Andersenbacteria bacterium]
MNPITSWLQNITMYRLMLYFMLVLLLAAILLSVVGVLPYSPWSIALQTILFPGLCWGVNKVISRSLKLQSNIESSLITGLILSAIVGPLVLSRDWLIFLVITATAIGSKYLLAIRRSHIFNPAAFGVVVSALVLGYPASWWIGSEALLPVILIGGVLMIIKIRRWHLIVSFLGVYLGLRALDALFIDGRSLTQAGVLLQTLATSPSILFFCFVMLIEPLTAPQVRSRRVAFGSFVGVTLFAFQQFLASVPYSLELTLLIGNIFTRIVNPDFRQAFVLRQKELFSSAIGSFWFEPTRRFTFKPGQFLEYTFAHPHPDTRGVRRYFSIASSPTEEKVLLTARFSEPGSTFKQALRKMGEGDEIVASKVAGDFVLPSDTAQKLVFIAGGIGITPFRSIVKYLLDTNQSRDLVLLYGSREEGDLIFRDVFEEARKIFNMNTVYVVSRVIDEQVIRKEIPDFTERLFYISGPEGMVQGLSKMLVGMGVSRRQIRRDYFPGYAEQG